MSSPKFVVGEYVRCDMDQGKLITSIDHIYLLIYYQGYVGNCWFIAGCVGIMQSKECFAKVVPKHQNFEDDYAGKKKFL